MLERLDRRLPGCSPLFRTRRTNSLMQFSANSSFDIKSRLPFFAHPGPTYLELVKVQMYGCCLGTSGLLTYIICRGSFGDESTSKFKTRNLAFNRARIGLVVNDVLLT